jgi:hypothetical protein
VHAAEAAGEEPAVEEGVEFSGDEAGRGTVTAVGLDAGEQGSEVAGDQLVQSSALGPSRGARYEMDHAPLWRRKLAW